MARAKDDDRKLTVDNRYGDVPKEAVKKAAHLDAVCVSYERNESRADRARFHLDEFYAPGVITDELEDYGGIHHMGGWHDGTMAIVVYSDKFRDDGGD